jgi:SAM-dependent methyltransferase
MADETIAFTPESFARMVDIPVSELPEQVVILINNEDLKYSYFKQEERDGIILEILKKINSKTLPLAGKDGKNRWVKGWQENLDAFIENDFDINSLVPKFVRPLQPIRLFKEFVLPSDPEFEFKLYNIYRRWLFDTFLKKVDNIYEFGCGSGYNLPVLADMFPEKVLFGLDWAPASKKIVDLMAEKYGWNMRGRIFDFFEPDETLKIRKNSAILTIGGMEQTGRNFEQLLSFFINNMPEICVHVEPFQDWLDKNSLVDYTSIMHDKQRNYEEGYPNRIATLEKEGRVKIIRATRVEFGSMFHDGYNLLAWKPISGR